MCLFAFDLLNGKHVAHAQLALFEMLEVQHTSQLFIYISVLGSQAAYVHVALYDFNNLFLKFLNCCVKFSPFYTAFLY
jgi:hypothetical protein